MGNNYVENFLREMRSSQFNEPQIHNTKISQHVIELAQEVKTWHENRPIPDRWRPVQLGRLAAQFNVPRDLMGAALEFAEWTEKRNGSTSFWQPK